MLTVSLLSASLFAQQTPTPPVAPAPRATLTADQATNVLKQLAELERTILQQRGTNLGSVIQKLRTAASSDAAAITPAANAGAESVLPAATWKSETPCSTRFIRAIAAVMLMSS